MDTEYTYFYEEIIDGKSNYLFFCTHQCFKNKNKATGLLFLDYNVL